MSFKTVTTIITDLETDQVALDAAINVAHRSDGHLTVLCLGVDYTQPGFYYAGASSLALQTSLAEAEKTARELEEKISSSLSNIDISWTVHGVSAQLPGLAQFLAQHTRFSDVVVLGRPYGPGKSHVNEAILESALFDAGVPVLVIPEGYAFSGVTDNVVIAWNESHEALAAVRAAFPIIRSAQSVNISIVEPPSHAPDRSDPGGALSTMLSRHGISAEVSILAKTMPRVSDVIARQVSDKNADILIMGAYGHSRFRESILGGATRNTLQQTLIPVFMAH